ncbi:PadR family transcriptional regulator [Herbidospora galbida]|uniref:PadR family transcriptional regulator n=2 Tax=Herbidospora galbida TaxID=2575442 RepID=A0A4U3LZF6_9ACTN|nr:PadR family transcriptional regulator [Herbidospora galbida]
MSEATYFILAALLDGPLHGYGIIQRAAEQSRQRVKIPVATLYRAVDRLQEAGLVVPDREEIVDGRARRYYRITDQGTEALAEEARRLSAAADLVIRRPGMGFA